MTDRGRLPELLEGLALEWVEAADAMPTVECARADARTVLERLHAGGFDVSILVTAVDRYPGEPRFEVVWQLLSIESGERARIRTRLGENESAPSVCDLWPGASFSERECWDMFGIRFEGHPDLRRLLMPAEYPYHPLRKDFPHQGIEPDALYRRWERSRRQAWQETRP